MTFEEYRQYLEEKLLIIGNDKNYDQAIIIAGGIGSGKSFSIQKFLNSGKYKSIDPDELKTQLLDIAKSDEMIKKFPRWETQLKKIKNMDLRNPNSTDYMRHMIYDLPGNPDKTVKTNIFKDKGRTHLPNIILDRTLQRPGSSHEDIAYLLEVGYKPENIHVVWVLTDYRVALAQNYGRKRRIWNDVLIQSHLGVKTTMADLVFKKYETFNINGDLAVVLAGKEMSKISYSNRGGSVVEDFKYFRIKKAGKRGLDPKAIEQVLKYVEKFAPNYDTLDMASIGKQYPETHR